MSCAYGDLWNAFKRIAADVGRDPSEKDALFYTTAVRTYGLTAPLQP